jgi:dihydrofolate reductase
MSELTIIAAIAPNGVIGRTSKPCENRAHDPNYFDGQPRARLLPCVDCGENERGRVPCNETPWSYPEHDARVEALTRGHAVIAGRKTVESLGKRWPMKGRLNHVVTSTLFHDDLAARGAWKAECLTDAAHDAGTRRAKQSFVIGGARLFAEALPLATTLELTLISKPYEGDVLFPGGEHFMNGDAVASAHLPGGRAPSEWWFECVERRPGTHADLTFTTWRRCR